VPSEPPRTLATGSADDPVVSEAAVDRRPLWSERLPPPNDCPGAAVYGTT